MHLSMGPSVWLKISFDSCYISLNLACYIPFLVGAADHPKSDEYLSNPRLAAYAVPDSPVVSWYISTCSLAKSILLLVLLILIILYLSLNVC